VREAEDLMRLAIDAARRGMTLGQSPFGCAISLAGTVVAVTHNHVLASTDITAHAEVTALREACRKTGKIHLEGAFVASTCEPCPMCMSALHWARVERVFYGAAIGDAAEVGFNELRVPAADIVRIGGSDVTLVPGILVEECRALFSEWRRSPDFRTY
jgi:tRNA(Arg) A34 adenosine deaminase TadA